MKYPLLHRQFDEICTAYPESVAIETNDSAITYQALQRKSEALAAFLLQAGITNDTVVATMLPSGIPLVTAVLGLLRSNNIYMPLDARLPALRLEKILSGTGCGVIITREASLPEIADIVKSTGVALHTVITLEDTLQAWTFSGDAFVKKDPDVKEAVTDVAVSDNAYIFFTSGTTGEGKPILGSHEGLSQFIQWEIKEFALDKNVRVSQIAQITFDASLRDIFIPLCTGGTLYIPANDIKYQTTNLIAWLQQNKISLLHCVPSVFRTIVRELEQGPAAEGNVFPALQYLLMAGEILYAKDIQQWRKVCGDNVTLVNLYGTSETTLVKTFHRIGELPADAGEALHVGQPIDQAFVAIMNGSRLCGIGEIGEVYIITRYMSNGYYRQPEKTAERFVANPLKGSTVEFAHRTGDMGRYRKDRSVDILGRQDDQVKINGIRTDLHELESVVLETEGVSQVVIVALPNAENTLELVCYYTGKSQPIMQFRQYLKERIVESLIPAHFIHLDEFPLSLNGKVDKTALPKPAQEESLQTADSPQGAGEEKMEAIWKEVFNKKAVGRQVSFFSLGGTSLKAIRIISKIYKTFELLITINDLFNQPTIAGLTSYVEKGRKKDFAEIALLPLQDTYEMSGVQRRIWAIDQFADNKTLYNVPEIYLFEGNLHTVAFEKALQTLVVRHEILRTTFEMVNGEPRQRIHETDKWNYNLEQLDYSAEADPMAAAIKLSHEISFRVFDLSAGPLLHTVLVKLSEDKHVFIFVTHHIISDAWSQEVIARDLLGAYEAYAAGKVPQLQALNIQYKDFSAWHNKRLEANLESHRSFWREQLVDGLAPLKLPIDYPRPELQSFEAEEITVRLDETVSNALRTLAQQQGASGFNVVMALINLLLYKCTNQHDMIIGSPVADRGHVDIENQVGVYFNTLPLRTKFNGADTFAQLVNTVKGNTLKAFEHIDYPFENILEDINLVVDKSRNPLYDAGLTYISFLDMGAADNEQEQADDNHGIRVKGIYPGFKYIKTDLWFKAVENGDAPFLFVVAYNTGLFKASFAAKLIRDLHNIAAIASAQPTASLDAIIAAAIEKDTSRQVLQQKELRQQNLEVLKRFKVGAKG